MYKKHVMLCRIVELCRIHVYLFISIITMYVAIKSGWIYFKDELISIGIISFIWSTN